MSSWIVCPTRNNIHLLREAVRTFRAQDIGDIRILIIDNGSTDGTAQWLMTQKDITTLSIQSPGLSVARSWNQALNWVFAGPRPEQYALVANNDIELRPDTYRHLVADGGGFVTAVGVRDRARIKPLDHELVTPQRYADPDPAQKRPHPDFSCYLIRREVFRTVGEFDENFKIAFCEDWDYHLRLHNAGIRAEALELSFLHHASQTVKNAEAGERERIMTQAAENREYFYSKWGVRGGTDEYYALFGNSAPPKDEDEPTP